MPKVYVNVEAGEAAYLLMVRVMGQYHHELANSGASIGLVMVSSRDRDGEPCEEPAVAVNGYAAIAKVKINSKVDRLEGKPDATIFVDGDWYDASQDGRRAAMFDHELAHLIPVEDEDAGGWKKDDLGRQVLKMRLHDFHYGGFDEVAIRHGEQSIEHDMAVGMKGRSWVAGV